MKPEIHPPYGRVAFRDMSTGRTFVTRSTLAGDTERPTVVIGGEMLPCIDVDISSDSHPLWTGRARPIDVEGRVQAFNRRYGVQR